MNENVSNLPNQAEINELKDYWQKEKQNPTMEYAVKGLPDICLGVLSDAEKIINQLPAQHALKSFQPKKVVFTLIDNGETRIIKIPKHVTKLEAALLTSVFEKEIGNNSLAKDEAERALECLKATPIAATELSDQKQIEALHNIFLFSVTNTGHVFTIAEFRNEHLVKVFKDSLNEGHMMMEIGE